MNIELLKRVRTRLVRMRHKRHFNMGQWIEKNECGTAACIAGHVLLMEGYKPPTNSQARWDGKICNPSGKNVSAFNAARKLLGLGPKQANRLFMADQWPDQFNGADCNNYDNPEVYNDPKVAARRIDRFIATNGRE